MQLNSTIIRVRTYKVKGHSLRQTSLYLLLYSAHAVNYSKHNSLMESATLIIKSRKVISLCVENLTDQ